MSTATRPATLSDSTLALIVYILYFVAYFTGITALIGVVIAHFKAGSADPVLASHFRFQIRTFWIGILLIVAGAVLSLVFVGYFVLLLWVLWSVVRNVKGVLALMDNRPIVNPSSWMFG